MDNTGKNMKEILKKVYYLERINYEQGKMINCLSQRCLELERDKKRELPLENYVSASIDSETIIWNGYVRSCNRSNRTCLLRNFYKI